MKNNEQQSFAVIKISLAKDVIKLKPFAVVI